MQLEKEVSFTLNGKQVKISAPPAFTLLEVLREVMNVTGPKEDCSKGECGACTVLVDGEAIASCLFLFPQSQGKKIVTIEGLSSSEKLDTIQEAFINLGASQCGHCIPGMVMSAKALLNKNNNPTLDDVKIALAGNICRCTGYTSIFEAILATAGNRRSMV